MLLLFSALLFSACDRDDDTSLIDEPMPTDTGLLAPKSCSDFDNTVQYNSNRAFAFDLLQSVNESESDEGPYAEENIFISPMSVSIALAMLYNGASGAGIEQMDQVLRLNGLDLETHNQNYHCLIEEVTSLDNDVVLNIANSIWSRNDFEAKEEFLNYADIFLDSEFLSRDFSDPAVLDEINDWIANKTEGNITNALDMIPGNVVMYLINAIYFNADWKYSFDPELTFEGSFGTLSGDLSQVEFMLQKNNYRFLEADQYKAIDIPYANDAFSLSIILPNQDINDFVADFSEAALVDAIDQMEETEVLLTMPKFELEFKLLLNDVLAEMGMPAVFKSGSLENIQEGWDLFVSRVIHQTFLEIDEVGTEAAGVTIIEIAENTSIDPEPTMNVNRPFLFYIRDRVNNNVLFSGKIVDPNL